MIGIKGIGTVDGYDVLVRMTDGAIFGIDVGFNECVLVVIAVSCNDDSSSSGSLLVNRLIIRNLNDLA